MTPPRSDVRMRNVRTPEPEPELETMRGPRSLGTRATLNHVGLGGKDALLTVRDMRSLLEYIQFVRRTALHTAVNVITNGVLIALRTGIAMKLRWFGPNP